jgi:hypothetical protein
MIRLKSETGSEKAPRRRLPWLLVAPVLAVITVFTGLTLERWWGKLALSAWKNQMLARGEIFDPRRIWPPPSVRSVRFSNDFARVTGELPPALRMYGGQYCSVVPETPGMARRGSQEPKPPSYGNQNSTNTWQDLEARLRGSAKSLQALRQLMKDPPASVGYDVIKQLEDEWIPNFVASRVAAQTLHAAVGLELHNGNLPGALENLQALSGAVRVYEQDPTLVSFMIRVAILGLSADAFWDALQAEGWTEPQLAALQQTCPCDQLLSQMPKTMEAGRAARISSMKRLRASSYGDWVRKYEEIYQSFGGKPPASCAAPRVRVWRDWVFHPLWQYAWADEEELHYLKSVQGDLVILREAAEKRAWAGPKTQLTSSHQNYLPPAGSWRFYMKLPMLESFSEVIGGSPPEPPAYPYPEFARAWNTTMKNLTLGEMVNAVVALKRYKLRHGQWPQRLAALVPEFATRPPLDLVDGRQLRYRLEPDGSFTLYSVGQDGQDDGGDPTPASSGTQFQKNSCWEGRDWVWPRATKISIDPLAASAAASGRRGE